MSEYAQRFAENRIDLSILPELTDQHLKDLGIILGDRLKILRAIRELGVDARSVAQPSLGAPKREDTAERRQVTVMFCDLVGSTALSARLDAEDLREVISTYQKCVAETVGRSEAFVAKYMGDGVLIYFGYPQAHEHDAERAVRVGLDIIANVGRLATRASEPLKVRVGIATGLVVVGDLVGEGAAQERGIVGETPNLAARLQGLAEPDSIVIAESTRRLVGDLFEYRDLGLVELKGLPKPIRALRIVGEGTMESRFEALHSSRRTAFIGREEETELLLRRWQRAKKREGQVVLISGEPGIGKSRLAAAILEQIAAEPHIRVRYLCSPHHADSALYPIIQRLERAAGFAPHDDTATKLDKFDALMVQTLAPAADRAIFADLLSPPSTDRYPKLDLSHELRRKRTIDAMMRRLEAMACERPVLAIFEDVHWVDPTSLDVLSRMIDRIRDLPVLLLVTFRPEFAPPWTGQPHVTALALNRLAPRATTDLVQRIIGNKALPEDIIGEIVARTDGVPLFIEELTNAALETWTGDAVRELVAAVPSSAPAVPATLHASLMARLDRLGSAKAVARLAAAIGREFSYELLFAVADLTESELTAALDRLTGAGLLFQEGAPPHASYLFKHALVRDAAYGLLLRDARKDLHARIGAKLEEMFPEVAETEPSLLVYHFAEGNLPEKAVEYWLKAGKLAVARGTITEALSHLDKGSALLSGIPDNPWRRQTELTLQISRASALLATLGAAAPAVREAYEHGRQLWEIAGRPSHFEPNLPLFWHHLIRGELGLADQLAEDTVQAGTVRNDVAVRFLGRLFQSEVCMDLGKFAASLDHSEHALMLYEPVPVSRRALFNGHIGVLGVQCRSLFCLGHLDKARSNADNMIVEARRLSQSYTLAYSLMSSMFVEREIQPADLVLKHAEELVALKFGWLSLIGGVFRSWCLSALGREAEGARLLAGALSDYRATGALRFVPFFLMLQADVFERAGDRLAALGRLTEAVGLVEKTQERWCEAELHRLKGELLKADGQSDHVESCFFDALAVARPQSAKTWELRAATSLARLWRDQGKRDEARDLLAPVYGWFTEGFDTLDLKEAKALLEQLAT
jgi:class 3 adenylate cyclase/tetratricopeptide (TPR) repeat protein